MLCDGKNGTPDLRDRFITGAGNIYSLDDTGGENEVKLEADQNVSHFHTFGFNASNNTGYFLSMGLSKKLLPSLPNGGGAQNWNGSGSNGSMCNRTGDNLITSLAVGIDASKPHENRPPYYALYYIMKIK